MTIDALLSGGVKLDSIKIWAQEGIDPGSSLFGINIQHLARPDLLYGENVHVCIGDNTIRQRVSSSLVEAGARLVTVVHPKAIVSSYAIVGAGTFLAAGSIVAARARLGRGVIVNHNAVVDHDCVLGEFVHVAPCATLGGAVSLANLVLIGAGANVLPKRNIGIGVVVGAGAVVTSDLDAGSMYVGVPAVALNKWRV